MDNIKNYTVIDLEMTGLSAKNDKIIEIGAAKIRNGELSEKYQTLVDPKIHIPRTYICAKSAALTLLFIDHYAHNVPPFRQDLYILSEVFRLCI